MRKINKFYILMGLLLLILVSVLVFSIRTVITSYMTSIELEKGDPLVTVNRRTLQEVYDWSFNRKDVSLIIESSGTPETAQNEETEN